MRRCAALLRINYSYSLGATSCRLFLWVLLVFQVLTGFNVTGVSAGDKKFVGSEKCGECHENEYSHFRKYAKKASSYDSIKVMQPKLTQSEFESCFECHTTGYGQPGGFVSETGTPELKDAGCEVCHGPGNLHVESQSPEDIKKDISIDDCNRCHSKERIEAFDFKPLLFGGAH